MLDGIGVLAPLANRNFRLLATANLSSLTGEGFFRVAVAVQVLAISGDDASAIAKVALTWAVGQLLALPVGGWVADRSPHRTVLIVADAWRGAMMAVIGVLSLTGGLELWHMMVLGFGFGIGNGFFNPSAMAFVPELVLDEHLPQANSFLGVARPAMVFIVGPLLGGLFVSAGGPGLAFMLRALTFGVSVAMLARIHVRRRTRARTPSAPLREVTEALRFVVSTRWAWAWLLGAGFATLLFFGPFEVLLPALLRLEFGMSDGQIALTLSYVLAAGGLGAIVAGTVLAQGNLPRRFLTTIYVAEAGGMATLVLFGTMLWPWQAVLAGFVAFTLFAVTDIIWATTMQRLVPRHMLGRVASLDWLVSVSLAPLGLGLAWVLQAAIGLRMGLVAAGVGGATVLLLLMTLPGTRAPERAGPATSGKALQEPA